MEPAAFPLLLVCLVVGVLAIGFLVWTVCKIVMMLATGALTVLERSAVAAVRHMHQSAPRTGSPEPDEASPDEPEDDDDEWEEGVLRRIGVTCLAPDAYGQNLPFCGRCGACRRYRA